MIKGAMILAIGYIAGYTHAAARNDEVTKAVQDLRKAWAEAANPSEEVASTGETSDTPTDIHTDTPEGETAP